jgi:hypothetical protein
VLSAVVLSAVVLSAVVLSAVVLSAVVRASAASETRVWNATVDMSPGQKSVGFCAGGLHGFAATVAKRPAS